MTILAMTTTTMKAMQVTIMRMTEPFGWARLFIGALMAALLISVITIPDAGAHPEDEFCTVGGGMDPALCRALQELDRAGDGKDGPLTSYSETETIDFERPALETFGLYIKIGIGHILPGGLDHILFVLALVLSTRRMRPLLIQISAFTVAHTATLGLVAAGVFAPPASIVEPLIAATIAFVAIENLFAKEMTRWRPLVVFLFGLIHGMGFAGFFGTLGLPGDQFWSALLGFNVGVELGQLAIAVGAFVALIFLRRVLNPSIYRRFIIWPSCALIGLTGLVWTIERLFFG